MKKLIAVLTIIVIFGMAGLSFAAARPGGKNGIYYVQGLVGSGAKDLDTLNIDGVGAPNTYSTRWRSDGPGIHKTASLRVQPSCRWWRPKRLILNSRPRPGV